MAKYEVVAETLGANPTYSKGDTIEDSGDLKPPFDFDWLERSGAIKKLDADVPTAETAAAEPSSLQMTMPPGLPPMTEHSGTEPPSDLSMVDMDDDQRAALAEAGIRTAADVRAASDEQLRGVKGIGPATLAKLREATQE
jgi:hypothetical protein